MTKINNSIKIVIISDATGETASALTRAAMTQFGQKDVFFTRYKNIRTKEQIDAILTEASIHHDLVVYTIVSKQLRNYLIECSRSKRIRSVDLMGPLLTALSNVLDHEPSANPGLLHAVNDDYFKRVEAMEFTLNHDDGKNIESLHLADVILVGVSRTSKTPLSIFLSLHGLKVVNVPLILGSPPPKGLFEIDQRKIFALTINADTLREIRANRLSKLGTIKTDGDYADMNKIIEEVEWANKFFKENKRWPVFNVTGKALEETAAEILRLLNMRKSNIFKQEQREKVSGEENS
ncbi:MAG: kinase/pyrophosphorylase [Bacteriovoracaceae bacterium]|nr:kinase/pyrophosphorylase [Bacteriovoracaceae bacterium]